MMRDFQIDNAAEKCDVIAAELRPVLRMLFPDSLGGRRERDLDKQRAGIDMHIFMPVGPPITLDFKFRSELWDDFALEFLHESYDHSRRWAGWIEQTDKQNDWIAYVFKPDWSCWLLPRQRLQQAWTENAKSWCGDYGVKLSENTDYATAFCPVPISVICLAVGGVRFANSETAETIERDGRFEHYCLCSDFAYWGYGPRWFCNKHRPDRKEPVNERSANSSSGTRSGAGIEDVRA